MPGTSVTFDFLSRGAAELSRDFTKVGDGATLAAGGAEILKRALEKARSEEGLTAAESTALASVLRRLGDDEDKAAAKALLADAAVKRLGETMKKSAEGTAGLDSAAKSAAPSLGALGTPLAALGAAAVALSPVLVTVGIGAAGFGLAAAAAIDPVLKAAQAAGGLAANMHKLDPEQQAAARSLLALKTQFAGFQASLAPTVLADFSKAAQLAGHALADIEPVSHAVGVGIGQLLDRVDAEFQSQRWQQFFSWMGEHAAQDVSLIAANLVDLTNLLPPLLEDLQPLATALLRVTDAGARVAGVFENVTRGFNFFEVAAGAVLGPVGLLGGVLHATFVAQDPSKNIQAMAAQMEFATPIAGQLTAGVAAGGVALSHLAASAAGAANKTAALAAETVILTDDLTKSLDPLLKYNDATIAAANDHDKLAAALLKSRGQVGLSTQAQRDSFSAAQAYIRDLENEAQTALSSGRGAATAAADIRAGFPTLSAAARNNAALRGEVDLLRGAYDALRREAWISQHIFISATGTASSNIPSVQAVLHKGLAGGTAGADPGWAWVGERGPELVRFHGGETVVPHETSVRIATGYASGAGFSGSPAGLAYWEPRAVQALQASLVDTTATALAQALIKASSLAGTVGGPTSGGGTPEANQILGRQIMLTVWPAGQWPALQALWQRESGWNQFATNPQSGAYGIPQSLPASKMASAGADWRTNPATQERWGIGYIEGRYGSPQAAWGHELAYGWYGGGLRDGLFTRPTLIGVGERGPERVSVTPVRSGGGGNTYNVTIGAGVIGSAAEMERWLYGALAKLHRTGHLDGFR